ncbi:hypothetical protein BSIN_4746 [Burkholderia singularis]|uniref:Uncharacterized protein n=1 Tax=Burkholderia singularis TaxID=1503053 RepID=A0A238HAC9_9BURK|nr:hypothetical protein BSIN_4746 [Burkholderia singularis]
MSFHRKGRLRGIAGACPQGWNPRPYYQKGDLPGVKYATFG